VGVVGSVGQDSLLASGLHNAVAIIAYHMMRPSRVTDLRKHATQFLFSKPNHLSEEAKKQGFTTRRLPLSVARLAYFFLRFILSCMVKHSYLMSEDTLS
jgi:hypothetical protein